MAVNTLSRELRNRLQSAVIRGREVAESAAAEALRYYGVAESSAPKHLKDEERRLRNRLRAHARQLGDALDAGGAQQTRRLQEQIAYEQWHRILFARFLIENDLLIYPESETPISLVDLKELVEEESREPWELAAEYASRLLPQIFRTNDPSQQVRLPKNRVQELERLVLSLDAATFKASDALGWTYQFWQAKRKDAINASGVRIGADELPAVTQLFTEDYMVEFLLHNSLGAWWVSSFPDKPLPVSMPYLRFVEEPVAGPEGEMQRVPAAGRFEGWPRSLKDFKALDPCCGSGHFLVFLLHILVPMRIALEGLLPAQAVDAVLRENLHGLELDPRCVEIAVFALALAAWTYPGAGGYRPLPKLNVACCGLPIAQKESEWLKLANGDERLRVGMRALYRAFQDAPTLGSLIDPKAAAGDMFAAGFAQLEPLLAEALNNERIAASDEATEAMLTASGLAQAARLLSGDYDLVITNTPYLGRGNQGEVLRAFCEKHYPDAKQDLANVMLERCLKLARNGSGVVQFVMPQNWLFLTRYKKQRESLLKRVQWNLLARLGPGAFETITGEVVNVILLTLTKAPPAEDFQLRGIDASAPRTAQEKAGILRKGVVRAAAQQKQADNPGAKVVLDAIESSESIRLRTQVCQGIATGDLPRYLLQWWEIKPTETNWTFFQAPVNETAHYGGKTLALRWEGRQGSLARSEQARIQGSAAWGRKGVSVRLMRSLPCCLYDGDFFDQSSAPIVPVQLQDRPALWVYCISSEFRKSVRALDQALSVTESSLASAPFDADYWAQVAQERYPNGLPKPYSDDPTQWIFHGHPCGSVVWDETKKWTAHGPLRTDRTVLQVAVARLLGYRWPAELDDRMELADEQREWVKRCEALAKFADADGIVCIPPVKGERPADERLLELLAAAYGDAWSAALLDKLLAEADFAGRTLEEWLRDGFFSQHCKLFHDRPFIWHIWDGERDGFSALVNYHKLDKKTLQALAYTYVGAWIEEQKRRQAAGSKDAKALIEAAVVLQNKLKAILEGETPCDIFVRWKLLAEQPLGWEPDINDGVRVNIRPFMLVGDVGKKGAGVLRDKPNIHWKKDRGIDPASAPWYELGPKYGEPKGARINAHHTTLAEKRKAREARR